MARFALCWGLWVVACGVQAQSAPAAGSAPAAAGEAVAAPAPAVAAQLEYTRDPVATRCPEPAALKDAVSEQLGYRVFERAPTTHILHVVITSARRGLRARVEVRAPDGTALGTREIDSPSLDCKELSAALTLAIRLALDPTHLRVPHAPAAGACPAPTVCPVCPPAQASVPARASGAAAGKSTAA